MSTSHPLASCVSSLRSSTAILGSSIAILDAGVNDFPRLCKVLNTTRHFDLLPSSTLLSAQTSLLATLTPELSSLLSAVEKQLDRLERREQGLAARCRLLAGRLEGSSLSRSSSMSRRREVRDDVEDDEEEDEREENDNDNEGVEEEEKEEERGVEDKKRELRLRQMRAKKERLGYMVERLELQAKQREGELRRSVGFGGS